MRIALAGDTMLGRGVGEELSRRRPDSLVAPEVAELTRAADLFVLNLECCISRRGRRWPDPSKPFFFRAPPVAVELLVHLGVSAVTLANNHALDYGAEALLDTLDYLDEAGIARVGAGPDTAAARAPAHLEAASEVVSLIGVTDHPRDFAAGPDRPGVAHAELRTGVPGWLRELVAAERAAGRTVVVSPHWGPNMVPEPLPYVVTAAGALVEAGATLVAGHSAHVFHGMAPPVLYDLGDFLDDYAVDPVLRNDLSVLATVTLEGGRVRRVEAVPLKIDYAFTGLARGEDARWVRDRLVSASQELGAEATCEDGAVVVSPRCPPG